MHPPTSEPDPAPTPKPRRKYKSRKQYDADVDYWTSERAKNGDAPEKAFRDAGLTEGVQTAPGTEAPHTRPRAATVMPARQGGWYW